MNRRTQFRLLVALTIGWAGWAAFTLIGQASPYTLRVIDDLGVPVAGASVDVSGRQVGTSSDTGLIEMEWNRSDNVIEVSAPGHLAQVLTLSERPDGVRDVVLKARVLRGTVTDGEGRPLEAAVVTAGEAAGRSDADGKFSVRGAEPGVITVQRPAWSGTSFEWDGGLGETVIELEPFDARAVHITGEAVRDELDRFIEMARTTELNALMIDLKDETGAVWYDSDDVTAHEVGAVQDAFVLEDVVAAADEAGLYVIGRLVLFNDPIAAEAKPSMAVWDAAAGGPLTNGNQMFLDPTDTDARSYALSLAEEACRKGIDEVQFDYVRFPDKRPEASQFDGGSPTPEMRIEAISSFLAEAVDLVHPLGCAVAADVFGYITAPSREFPDGGVGQNWEQVVQLVDVVSPMVYPSHYDNGFYPGIDDPNDQPGAMVDYALQDGMERLEGTVIIRPWLQDFFYTEGEVREQIDVAERYGFGWMLWNAKSEVTEDALDPE